MFTYRKVRDLLLKERKLRKGKILIQNNKTYQRVKTPIFHFSVNEKSLACVRKQDSVDYQNLDTFHRAVWPVLLLGQIFGMMPVSGICEVDSRKLKFESKSIRVLHSFASIGFAFLFMFSFFRFLSQLGFTTKNVVGLVFFSINLSSMIMFLRLAKHWPQTINHWMKTELIFLRKPYQTLNRKLSARIRWAAYGIVILSAMEHSLFYMSNLYSYQRKIELCSTNSTDEGSFSNYVTSNYEFIFRTIPESFILKVIIVIVNSGLTFVWNYVDLFIMVVSKGLAYRFEQIKVRINNLVNKDIPESEFIEIREDYVKLCELLEYVDDELSGIILLSCGNNLYFICFQMLNIFNKLPWNINYIYFWYSLIYLVSRAAFVLLSAASIHDESNESMNILRRVSRNSWCIEVERLIFQMNSQTVALSGKKFFYLTRRLLFGMAGTMVTYELVLLQIDAPHRQKQSSIC